MYLLANFYKIIS